MISTSNYFDYYEYILDDARARTFKVDSKAVRLTFMIDTCIY